MKTNEILHIIRNPWGWSEEEVRQARIAAADLIEQQAKRIDELESTLFTAGHDMELIGLDTSDIKDALGGDEGIERVAARIELNAPNSADEKAIEGV